LFRNQIISVGWRMEADFFRRPKLTLSCSAEGTEGRKEEYGAMGEVQKANKHENPISF
jgi:hypothetical protein